MPVIVIGADTPTGAAIVDALRGRAAEVRAFVSDETVGEQLRGTEVKVATGDLSDVSHVEGACLNCFCAVLVTESLVDGRELAFAGSPAEAVAGWQAAIRSSGITRAIWVGPPAIVPAEVATTTPEARLVPAEGRSPADVAAEVAILEDAAEL